MLKLVNHKNHFVNTLSNELKINMMKLRGHLKKVISQLSLLSQTTSLKRKTLLFNRKFFILTLEYKK